MLKCPFDISNDLSAQKVLFAPLGLKRTMNSGKDSERGSYLSEMNMKRVAVQSIVVCPPFLFFYSEEENQRKTSLELMIMFYRASMKCHFVTQALLLSSVASFVLNLSPKVIHMSPKKYIPHLTRKLSLIHLRPFSAHAVLFFLGDGELQHLIQQYKSNVQIKQKTL